ncbi:hypothetical protein V6N13_114990 [Hibiscus sabdariffa]|uniref:Complex 1 LYR protein domain-containing protein n=1 Tax=Hibiscus sabdariffa TaxID=183260 RepID=A0ABR2U3H5_9ROSI
MEKALRVYAEMLRLVRRLPKDSRPYYAKYARENFVNYRDFDASDSKALDELFLRAYNHSLWVLNKYSVDESAAQKLKQNLLSPSVLLDFSFRSEYLETKYTLLGMLSDAFFFLGNGLDFINMYALEIVH